MSKFVWVAGLILGIVLLGCNRGGTGQTPDAPAPTSSGPRLTELKIEDVVVGDGPELKKGDAAYVTYTGKLRDGTEFDSNDRPDGTPFRFVVGAGMVIQGWDEGVQGMRVGGTRKLSIPAEMAYGNRAQGKIPANSDLFFEIKLLDKISPDEDRKLEPVDQVVGTGREIREGSKVTIEYVARLVNGRIVEESRRFNEPITFTVGKEEAVVAIERGLIGAREGGVRILRLTPSLMNLGTLRGVAPDSIVVYEITVKKVE